jgi:hypothetical protein
MSNKKAQAEQVRRRGKTGRITGLAYATPAPVSFFRSRLAFCGKIKKQRNLPYDDGRIPKSLSRRVVFPEMESKL